MEFINTYIAPWVLPNQAFPIHCVWQPDKNLSKIIVVIPERYEMTETLNFSRHDFDKASNSILIQADDLRSNNYFGIILKYPSIIEEVEKRDAVDICFLDLKNELIHKLSLNTRIVRPKLELVSFPKEVMVTDRTNPRNLITLEVLHKGFGMANLNIEVMHSGNDISKNDSLYYKVLEDMFIRILKVYDEESPETIDAEEIDDELIKTLANNIFKQPFRENLPFNLDKEQKKQLKKIMKDESRKKLVYRIIYSSLRSLLLSALLYYGERHPVEDIKLVEGRIVATIKQIIDELTVRISYYDSFENDYPPLEAKIKVIDKRDVKKLKEFEAPINIIWKKDVLELEDLPT